ncbi:MAG: cation-transporting P-type ATPase [bacterium]
MKNWWRLDIAELVRDLNTDSAVGLTNEEAAGLLKRYGFN